MGPAQGFPRGSSLPLLLVCFGCAIYDPSLLEVRESSASGASAGADQGGQGSDGPGAGNGGTMPVGQAGAEGGTLGESGAASGGAGAEPAGTMMYDFETSTDGFVADCSGKACTLTTVASSSKEANSGSNSLAVEFSEEVEIVYIRRDLPGIVAGQTLTFSLWTPDDGRLGTIQAFAQQGAIDDWLGVWNTRTLGSLTQDGWTDLEVVVPADYGTIQSIGVRFEFADPYSGTFYLDSVAW
jgi:hypothetical protein